ncbi:NAD(P)-binding protein [Meredithblackwellia eburnea MCA 4105]
MPSKVSEQQKTKMAEKAADELRGAGAQLSPIECLRPGQRLRDKVIVITGGASGFGKDYAMKAASLGAHVVVGDVSLDVLNIAVEITGAGGKAYAAKCDVTSWEDQVALFRLAVNKFGRIDSVVVNAGVAEGPDWLKGATGPDGEPVKPDCSTLDINAIGAAYTVNLAFHHLKKNPSKGHKSIVILGSLSSFFPIPLAPMYTMSKHAVMGLFRSTHFDGAAFGINVNIVCPWFVLTPILKTPIRLILAGLPTNEVATVVEAMVYASSTEEGGLTLAVDPSGVLSLPFETFGVGEDGYIKTFTNRARGAIRPSKTIVDVVVALARVPFIQNTAMILVLVFMCLMAYYIQGQVDSFKTEL